MPLSANICSMISEPEKMLMNQPIRTVMTGSSALRHAWE